MPGTDGCFVGIDLGTSGCRAIAIDAAGSVLAEARAPLPPSRRDGACSEQDPADWWRATLAVLDGIAGQGAGPVAALAVDGTSSTLLLCDAAGRPCTPALMYDDRRAAAAAARVAAVAPADIPALGAGSALSKLLYLLDRPQAATAAHALHQADWIAGRLGAGFDRSDENNCLKLGYDPVLRAWPGWLERLGLPAGILPRVQPVGTPYGLVGSELDGRHGLSGDTLIVAGTTDSNAAALAAGLRESGDAMTSLGSTLVLKILSPRPIASARYGVYSHRIGRHWLVGGASNSGGAVLRQYFSDSEITRLSRQIDPAHPLGLGYYPLPARGERFPRNDPQMAPRMAPRPEQPAAFLQALLEGIADIEAEGYRRLAELGAPPPSRVFSAGGGAGNPTWLAIRGRRLGVPLLPARHVEAAYGAALLARDAVSAGA